MDPDDDDNFENGLCLDCNRPKPAHCDECGCCDPAYPATSFGASSLCSDCLDSIR